MLQYLLVHSLAACCCRRGVVVVVVVDVDVDVNGVLNVQLDLINRHRVDVVGKTVSAPSSSG